MLSDGVDALGARLTLAGLAERSIDAQYFIVHGDLTGTLFVDHLLEAADRGVRVRLLIDDIETIGDDEAIAAIASHPNFEPRVFDPFAHRSSARYAEFITDLERVDHRMHDKSFVVDNQISIVGGRNIADDYFDANPEFEFEFDDLDLAAFGPVAQEVSKAFDTEVGLFIDSPALAEWAAGKLESRQPEHSYRVRINEDDAIEWVRQTGEGERVYDKEPETGAWRRFKADFYGILPVEEKL